MDSAAPHRKGLNQLLELLKGDPFNPSLLSIAALLAFDSNDLPLCQELVERLASVSAESEALQKLQVLLPIAQKRFGGKAL